jgi:hypothetical protein
MIGGAGDTLWMVGSRWSGTDAYYISVDGSWQAP